MNASTTTSTEESRLNEGALPGMGRRSAIDAVHARFATAIWLGLLKPGEKLPGQKDVALGLSVSPMTARRAMASMADEGIVVRRRGRAGGTFVADDPPQEALKRLRSANTDAPAIHALVDRRLLAECAVTHFAATQGSNEELERLEALTEQMARAEDWSEYHQADSQFHRLVAEASHLGGAAEIYNEALTELYEHFIPYPIEALHRANEDHIALVAALMRRDVAGAVEIARTHVETLHRTMFMELSKQTPDE